MGAQGIWAPYAPSLLLFASQPLTMKAAMKAMKSSGVMTKTGINEAISTTTGLKKKDVSGVIAALGEVAAAQVKKHNKFTIPGIAMLKLKHRPARKATTRMMFGELKKVGPKPASKVVKAFAKRSFKDSCN